MYGTGALGRKEELTISKAISLYDTLDVTRRLKPGPDLHSGE